MYSYVYIHINLLSFQVWNYDKVSYPDLVNMPRQFIMQHVKGNGDIVELGICERGPFGRVGVTSPRECSE